MERELVTLKGVTQKGKNRIREHGSIWRVLDRLDDGNILFQSVSDGYMKWLKPDFEVANYPHPHAQ